MIQGGVKNFTAKKKFRIAQPYLLKMRKNDALLFFPKIGEKRQYLVGNCQKIGIFEKISLATPHAPCILNKVRNFGQKPFPHALRVIIR